MFPQLNMKDKKEKHREPYRPEDTPNPPQIIDPQGEREKENPVEGKSASERRKPDPEASKDGKQHLLSDESDIEDETTI